MSEAEETAFLASLDKAVAQLDKVKRFRPNASARTSADGLQRDLRPGSGRRGDLVSAASRNEL